MRKLFRICALLAGLAATFFVLTASDSQNTGDSGRGDGARRDWQGRGRFDPAQMMERQMERFQERLEFSDEEWTAVKPFVQGVIEKQRDARFSPFMWGPGRMGGGPGEGFGPPDAPPPGPPGSDAQVGGGGAPSERGDDRGRRREWDRGSYYGSPSPEAMALQEAVYNEETPEADLQAKLKEFRSARQKQEDELKTARENLRELVSVRQEALCVLMGLLE